MPKIHQKHGQNGYAIGPNAAIQPILESNSTLNMLSYWEKQSFTRYDHIVIGSGITGISVAIELKSAYPKSSVLVLERGLLPTGATTRNAGFASMGSAGELLADLKTQTEEAVVDLFMRRKEGLDLLRKRLGDDGLGYRADGSFELLTEKDLPVLEQIDYLNGLLGARLGKPVFRAANESIKRFGFSENQVAGLIENCFEASIDSGLALKNLIALALSKGIEIKTGADVQRFDEEANEVRVVVNDPFRKTKIELCSETLSVCTNAFTKTLLPDEDILPGRGQILVTKPLPGLRFRGVFHFDAGYYYFREIDGRVLFGGGRNLDFEGERTTEFSLNERIQQDLEEKLRDMILPGQNFEIDMRWAGIMAFGPTKAPVVKAFSDRVFGAFRMGGMGIALASCAASEVTELILSFRN